MRSVHPEPSRRAPVQGDAEQTRLAEVAPEFEHECVEFFSELVQVLGVPRSVGQIYGLLFASPQPLSFTDIVERLDLSKGSASQGLQMLRGLGAVQHVSSPSDRRDLFEPHLSLRKLVGGVLREKVEPLLEGGNARMQRLRAASAKAPGPVGEKFSQSRVKQLEAWRRQMGLLLPVLKTLLGPGRA
jgi:HTH-type transcriptional regulator, glycine betaine synthesis regulator